MTPPARPVAMCEKRTALPLVSVRPFALSARCTIGCVSRVFVRKMCHRRGTHGQRPRIPFRGRQCPVSPHVSLMRAELSRGTTSQPPLVVTHCHQRSDNFFKFRQSSTRDADNSSFVKRHMGNELTDAPLWCVFFGATVPRRIATDILIGEAASALSEELLRALGVTHMMLFSHATRGDHDVAATVGCATTAASASAAVDPADVATAASHQACSPCGGALVATVLPPSYPAQMVRLGAGSQAQPEG